MSTRSRVFALIAAAASLGGCASHPPMPPVDYVDLDRFMGKWYVIANIPTFLEKGAYNAVEIYEMNDDGTVATTFRFRDGGFDGEIEEFTPRGFIRDEESNALWGMRFIWPFKADYRIVYLDDDYDTTIIGRIKRDYVWLMAREPEMPDDEYARLLDVIESLGYDRTKVQRVPQSW